VKGQILKEALMNWATVTTLANNNSSGGGTSIGKTGQCAVINMTSKITYIWKATITNDRKQQQEWRW